jgi:hypothetical protein
VRNCPIIRYGGSSKTEMINTSWSISTITISLSTDNGTRLSCREVYRKKKCMPNRKNSWLNSNDLASSHKKLGQSSFSFKIIRFRSSSLQLGLQDANEIVIKIFWLMRFFNCKGVFVWGPRRGCQYATFWSQPQFPITPFVFIYPAFCVLSKLNFIKFD